MNPTTSFLITIATAVALSPTVTGQAVFEATDLQSAIDKLPAERGHLTIVGTYRLSAGVSLSRSNVTLECEPGTVIEPAATGLTLITVTGANDKITGCSWDGQFSQRKYSVAVAIHATAAAANFAVTGNHFNNLNGIAVWLDGMSSNPSGIVNAYMANNTYSNMGVPGMQSTSPAVQVNNPTGLRIESETFDVISGDGIHLFVLGNTARKDSGASFTITGVNCTRWNIFCIEQTDYNWSSYEVSRTRCDTVGYTGAGCLSLTPGPALSSGTATVLDTLVTWASGNEFDRDGSWIGQPFTLKGAKYIICSVSSAKSLVLCSSAGTISAPAGFTAPYNGPVKFATTGIIRDNIATTPAGEGAKAGSSAYELDAPNAIISGNKADGPWSNEFAMGGGNQHVGPGNTSIGMRGFFLAEDPSWIKGGMVVDGNTSINSCYGMMQTTALIVRNNQDFRNPGATNCPGDKTGQTYNSILVTSPYSTFAGIGPNTLLDGNILTVGPPLNGFNMSARTFVWYGINGQVSVIARANKFVNQNATAFGTGFVQGGPGSFTNSIFEDNEYTNLASVGNYGSATNLIYRDNRVLDNSGSAPYPVPNPTR